MSKASDATSQRLSEVFAEAQQRPIEFDDDDRFVFFSDCHRGDNSWVDDFAHNQTLVFHALQHYFHKGYTYVELGDGDELWQNPVFENIRHAHSHIFWILSEFHKEQRLHMVWGNHDIERSDPNIVAKQLHSYFDDRANKFEPLLPGLTMSEGLVFRHSDTGDQILAVHGHQGSKINDRFWRFGRFAVRYGWSRLQAFGIKDPTRPSQDRNKQYEVEANIKEWIAANNNQVVICGHTHRPNFPVVGAEPYFNTGSCVHPRFITCIELAEGNITLVKWWVTVDKVVEDVQGPLFVMREVIRGPRKLRDFHAGRIGSASEPAPVS
jgi:predicted phosphodiesterase